MKKCNLFTGIMILCMVLFLLTSAAFAEEAGELGVFNPNVHFPISEDYFKNNAVLLPRSDMDLIEINKDGIPENDQSYLSVRQYTEDLKQKTSVEVDAVYLALYDERSDDVVWVGKFDKDANVTTKLLIKFKSKPGNAETDMASSSDDAPERQTESDGQGLTTAEATPAPTEMEAAHDSPKETPAAEQVNDENDEKNSDISVVIKDGQAYLYANTIYVNAKIYIGGIEKFEEDKATIKLVHNKKETKSDETKPDETKPDGHIIVPIEGEAGFYQMKAAGEAGKGKLGEKIIMKVAYAGAESEEKELTVEADIKVGRKGDALSIVGTFDLDALNIKTDDQPKIVIAEDDDTENNEVVELELKDFDPADANGELAEGDSIEGESAEDEPAEEVEPTEDAPAEQLRARQVYCFTCQYDLKNTDAKKLHMTVKLDSDALGEYDVDIPEKRVLLARARWENAENTITYDAKKHGLQLQVRTDANADWQNVSVDQNGAFSVTIGDDQFTGTVYHKADDKEKADNKEGTNEIAGLPDTKRNADTYTDDLRIASDNYEVSWEGQTEGEYVKAEYTIEKKSIAVAVKAEQKDVPEYTGEEKTIEFNFVANLNEEEELNSDLQHEVEDEVLKGVADYCWNAYAEDPLKGTDAGEYSYDANAMVKHVREKIDGGFNNYAVTVDIEGEIIGRIDKATKTETLFGECEYDGEPHSIESQVVSEFEKMENTLKNEEYIEGEEYSNNTLKDLRKELKETKYTNAGGYYKSNPSYCAELNGILKNYRYKINWKLCITAKDISALAGSIKLDAGQVPYDGTEHKPKVIVRDSGKELAEGTDYRVEYYMDNTYTKPRKDFVNPGTTYIKVIGEGKNYQGEYLLNEPFEITKRTEDQIEASIEIKKSWVYDGTSANEHVTYTVDDVITTPQEVLWYKDGTELDGAPKDAGTYTVKAEWEETETRETCSAEAEFKIKQKNLKDGFEIKLTPESIEADGNAPYKPTTIKVIHGDNVLEEDVDYELDFSENTAQIGTVTVIVKGINNYKGSIQGKYSIKAPEATPTAAPTAAPTATPTAAPTATPTPEPTATPTTKPTAAPTPEPTVQPVFNADSGTAAGKGGNEAKDADASAPNATEETGAMRIFADKQLLFLSAAAIVSLIAFVFCLIACKRQKQDLEKARFKMLDHQSRRSNRTIHQENDEADR